MEQKAPCSQKSRSCSHCRQNHIGHPGPEAPTTHSMGGNQAPDDSPELFCTLLIPSRRCETSRTPTCTSALSAFEGREGSAIFSFLRVRLRCILASFAANQVSRYLFDCDCGKRSLCQDPILPSKHRVPPMIHAYPG